MISRFKISGLKKCYGEICLGKLLPATNEYFAIDKYSKDGFNNTCKKCKAIYDSRYRRENKAEIAVAQYRYRVDNRGSIRTQRSESYRAIREFCLSAYGHKCIWPGCKVAEYEFLAFDHKNNDGRIQRQKLFSARTLCNWLIKNNFPDTIQLLCHNHNYLKDLTKRKLGLSMSPDATACRKSIAKLRLLVLTRYGLSCNCCGESDLDLLTIDHINGGGTTHIKNLRKISKTIYAWLRDHSFPSGYRSLCHNCNKALGHYGGCPHKENRES